MDIPKQYYMDGHLQKKFKRNGDLEKIIQTIRSIHADGPMDGFTLEEKYGRSKDIRPNVYSYDVAFINILFSNEIPALLKQATGKDLYLAHIQLRISFPGKSYMAWHRDTHVYGGKSVGNIPPVHKIIFYPKASGSSDEKIKFIPGSHRRMFNTKILDLLQTLFLKHKTMYSSDDNFMLFDTTLLHHVVPEARELGSYRLIYSFVDEQHLSNYDTEQELISMYKDRMKHKGT